MSLLPLVNITDKNKQTNHIKSGKHFGLRCLALLFLLLVVLSVVTGERGKFLLLLWAGGEG